MSHGGSTGERGDHPSRWLAVPSLREWRRATAWAVSPSSTARGHAALASPLLGRTLWPAPRLPAPPGPATAHSQASQCSENRCAERRHRWSGRPPARTQTSWPRPEAAGAATGRAGASRAAQRLARQRHAGSLAAARAAPWRSKAAGRARQNSLAGGRQSQVAPGPLSALGRGASLSGTCATSISLRECGNAPPACWWRTQHALRARGRPGGRHARLRRIVV